jgi:hypothetical protein
MKSGRRGINLDGNILSVLLADEGSRDQETAGGQGCGNLHCRVHSVRGVERG